MNSCYNELNHYKEIHFVLKTSLSGQFLQYKLSRQILWWNFAVLLGSYYIADACIYSWVNF